MFVGAGAEKVEVVAVLVGARRHQARDLHLAHAFRHLRKPSGTQPLGDFLEQLVDARHADGGEHRFYISFGVWNKRHKVS